MKDEFSNLEFDATDILMNQQWILRPFTYVVMRKEEKNYRKIDNLLNNKKDFYGFDKSNSDAPPNAYAKRGELIQKE